MKLADQLGKKLAFLAIPFELVVGFFGMLEQAIIQLGGTLVGLSNVILEMVNQIMSGNFSNAFSLDNLKEVFQENVNLFMYDVFRKAGQLPTNTDILGPVPVSGNTTVHNGDININQEFKEKMDADRIAFTLMDQIQKATRNPKGAKGLNRAAGGVTRD